MPRDEVCKRRVPKPMAVRAAELVLAYARGRPAQTQNVRVIRSLEDLTEAELIALAGLYRGRAGRRD